MGDIGVLAGRVDNEEQVIADIRHHQVVRDPAVIVGEHRIAHPSWRESRDIARHKRFKRQGDIDAA